MAVLRFVGFLVSGLVLWFIFTFIFGVAWTTLGLPYKPEWSNLLNSLLLPVGFYTSAKLIYGGFSHLVAGSPASPE